MNSLNFLLSISEKFFGLDMAESETLNKFLQFAKTSFTSKEAKALKLTIDDPRSICEYFHEIELKGDDKVKYYKMTHNTRGMTSEQVEEKAAKTKLKFPSLYVSNTIVIQISSFFSRIIK